MNHPSETYRRVASNKLVYRQPFGELGYLLVGATFFVGAFWLAITNLLDEEPISTIGQISSVLWVFLLIALLYALFEQGPRKAALGLLACCIQNRFIEVRPDSDPLIEIGFQFMSRKFYQLQVRASGITDLYWSAGQASDRTGQDCHDWHVVLWFEPDSAIQDRELFLPGLVGSRSEAELFGHLLVVFFDENDIHIHLAAPEIVGKTGEVVQLKDYKHRVRVDGNEFTAWSKDGPHEVGSAVQVTAQRGTLLDVATKNSLTDTRPERP